jgi:hypothetical protein
MEHGGHRRRYPRFEVWLLRAVAAAFGVPVRELLAACPVCGGHPPRGFTCQACGTDGPPPAAWRADAGGNPEAGRGAGEPVGEQDRYQG